MRPDQLNISTSGRIAAGNRGKANTLGVTNEHERENSEENPLGSFKEIRKSGGASGRMILDPLPPSNSVKAFGGVDNGDNVARFVPFSEASTGVEPGKLLFDYSPLKNANYTLTYPPPPPLCLSLHTTSSLHLIFITRYYCHNYFVMSLHSLSCSHIIPYSLKYI